MYYQQQQSQYNQDLYQQSLYQPVSAVYQNNTPQTYGMNGGLAINNAPVASMPVNVSQTGIPRDKMRQDMAQYICQNQNLDSAASFLAVECAGPVQNWQTGLFDKVVTRLMTTVDFLWATKGQNLGIDAIYNMAIEETWNFAWVGVIVDNYNYFMQDSRIYPKQGLISQLRQALATRMQQFNQLGLNANNAPMNVNPASTPGYQSRPQGMYAAAQGLNKPQQHTSVTYTNQNASLEDVYGDTLKLTNANNDVYGNTTVYTENTVQQTTTPYMSHQSLTVPTSNSNTVNNDTQKVRGMGNLKQPHELISQAISTNTVHTPINEFDFTNEEAVTKVFEEIVKEDTSRKGLKPDEVRFLTKREQKEAWRNGVTFEQPRPYPLTANPFKFYIHVVLTDKGTIRQYLTPVEEKDKMEYSEHQCILANLRKDPVLQRQKAASLRPFDFTTLGGVVHDRWQDAPINLEINLDKANKAETEEEKERLIKFAYDTFVKDAERENKEYHNGVAEWKRNHPEESEDGFGPSEFALPPSKQEENENKSRSKDKIVFNKHVFDKMLPVVTFSAKIDQALEENLPIVDDQVEVNVVTTVENIAVFDHYSEKEKVEELLEDFYWKEGNEPEPLRNGVLHFVRVLKNRKDKLPEYLFERLNNIATESINDSLEHIFNTTLHIDSFIEDGEELVEYIKSLYETGELPNSELAFRMLTLNLVSALRTLNRDDEDDDTSADNKLVRTIVSKQNNIVVSVPHTAKANGVSESGDTIDKDINLDLWQLLYLQYEQIMKSQNPDNKFEKPYHNLYVTFMDGSTYKALPAAAKSKNFDELTEDEPAITTFSLIKLRAY